MIKLLQQGSFISVWRSLIIHIHYTDNVTVVTYMFTTTGILPWNFSLVIDYRWFRGKVV